MGATVQDVLERNRENVGLLGTGQVGDVSVERNTLLSSTGLGNSQADTQDGVGTQVVLVGGAIQLVEELINLGLVLDVDVLLDKSGADCLVDVGNSLQDTLTVTVSFFFFFFDSIAGSFGGRGRGHQLTLSEPLALVTITELVSLVLTYTINPVNNSTLRIFLNFFTRIYNEPVEAPEGTIAR